MAVSLISEHYLCSTCVWYKI